MTARLPNPGGDDNTWGDILNTFLDISHNGDGTLQTTAVEQAGAITSVNGKTTTNGSVVLAASDVNAPTSLAGDSDVSLSSPSNNQVLAYNGSASKWQNATLTESDITNLTSDLASRVQIGGDLSGTATSPTVAKVNGITLPSSAPSANQVLTATSSSATAWSALSGTLLNDRGAIQSSTQYNVGDIVAYQGQQVLITTATESSSWTTHWYDPPTLTAGTYMPITSKGVYYAADWGVVADGVTNNSNALNSALQYMYQGSEGGGFLVLPAGYDVDGNFIGVFKSIIIPPNCFIVGQGIQVSAIKLLAGANCDVVQFQTYDSTYQSNILYDANGSFVTPTSVRNAYYAGLMHLTIDGNRGAQSATSYNYGVNMTTSPYNTEAPTDSSFDPTNFLFNVEITECTGDGLYHYGRGQLRVTNCISRINNGWGAVTSFDSLYTGNNFGFNGLGGVYVNFGACDGAANKSYNNGNNAQWTSGKSYAAGAAVMYNGAMYRAINAVSNDTTAPSSDTTNWAALTANAPYGWGVGFYFDSNASEDSWVACDGQQNMASDYYLNQYAHSITLLGQSSSPAYTSNPNYYASVVLNGATGCLVDVAFNNLANLGYVLRIVNSAARNDIRMVGDTTYAAILSPDSMTLPTSTNAVRVNGTTLSAPGLPLLTGATFTGAVAATDFAPSGLTGATAASRYVGATASGAPTTGTFVVGDYVIDQTAKIWICTTAGTPGTWTQISGGSSGATLGANTFTGNQTAPAFIASGLTGATAASRYVGATTGGAPTSGTFNVGDFCVDQTGAFWICTTAGTIGSGCVFTEVYPGTGLTNPMTTAGDTIYGTSSGTPARLPGSTAATPKVLTQTGTGSASAAPVWATQNYNGLFGDGSDGAVAMNGTNTFSGLATLSGSTYTLTRDVFAASLTVSNGVTVKTNGYLIFCTGTVTNSGTIGIAGGNASGATGGSQTLAGSLGVGAGGPNGTSGNGAQGTEGLASAGTGYGGASGAGSSGTAAAQLNPKYASAWAFRKPSSVLSSMSETIINGGATPPCGGASGSSGGGDGTNSGGGGGGGGPIIVILAWSVINNGTILCPGGNGGTPPTGNCGGGGGGGGGNIIVYTLSAWTAGTTNVSGGSGGSGVGTGAAGSAGGSGSVLNVIVQ